MAINKVLVVDDSLTELANIKAIVADAGCVIFTASNGLEAIHTAKTAKPDLIFLDIVMPDQDGFSTCRELNQDSETKGIPVIFATSKDQKQIGYGRRCRGPKATLPSPTPPMRSWISSRRSNNRGYMH